MLEVDFFLMVRRTQLLPPWAKFPQVPGAWQKTPQKYSQPPSGRMGAGAQAGGEGEGEGVNSLPVI